MGGACLSLDPKLVWAGLLQAVNAVSLANLDFYPSGFILDPGLVRPDRDDGAILRSIPMRGNPDDG